jgi:hypothetical protein
MLRKCPLTYSNVKIQYKIILIFILIMTTIIILILIKNLNDKYFCGNDKKKLWFFKIMVRVILDNGTLNEVKTH